MNAPELKMNEVLGLLFLICITAVGLRLAVARSLEWKALSSLLLFGLLAGFVIARFEEIQWLGISKDVGVKTFQKQVDAIRTDAVSKIAGEVDAQRESLQLVIADANTTREKLAEQKRSLEGVYDKTKTLESGLDIQKKDIERTVQKNALIERGLQDAQNVLGRLEQETKVADEKLKLLTDKTNSIKMLADGRLKVGALITGEPALLDAQWKQLAGAYNARDFPAAFDLAVVGIKMIEDSETVAEGAGISTSSLRPDGVAEIYRVGSDCARITGKTAKAVEWARKGVKHADSGSGRAALVLSLSAANDQPEVDKIVRETVGMDPKIAQEFREVMLRVGITIP